MDIVFGIHEDQIYFFVQFVAEVNVPEELQGNIDYFGSDLDAVNSLKVVHGKTRGAFAGAESDGQDFFCAGVAFAPGIVYTRNTKKQYTVVGLRALSLSGMFARRPQQQKEIAAMVESRGCDFSF